MRGDDALRVMELDPSINPADGLLGLDVETTYLTDRGQYDPEFRIRTVQFGTEDGRAYVLDLTVPEEKNVARGMLSCPEYAFCSHTPMDVLAVHAFLGIDIAGRNLDTRSLAIMADPDKEHDRDLKTLATSYGMPELAAADAELYEWMRDEWVRQGNKKNAARSAIEHFGWNTLARLPSAGWPEVFVRYAGLDAIAVRRLVPLLVQASQAPAELLRVERRLDTKANRITMRGLRVDTDALEVLLKDARTETGEAKSKAEEIAGVNINGPKILGWLAQEGVDWSEWPGDRTDKGSPSLAKENVLLLQDFDLTDEGRVVVEQMIRQRKHMDLLRKTEDVSKRLVWHDGIPRIHPELNPRGASTTARMSSSRPNVQNFSKKDARHRGMLLPDPGYLLATIDFAQIELRVVAALAREETMIDVIKSGGDLHDLTVDLLREMGVEIIRQTGKMANFLIVYGGGPKALATQARIPLEIAANVVYGMRDAYPAIEALKAYLGMEKEAIRTISNRRLPVTRNKKTGDLRGYANLNYAVQSAARELLVDAWLRFEDEFGHDGVVWYPIHDELVLQIPEDADVESVLKDAERAMTLDFMGVPIAAEAIVLRDEHGVSRWMPGDVAEKIAKEKASA